MTTATNRQWVLVSRPTGKPTKENFELVESDVSEPGLNEVLIRTLYMSVDPYMRGRMRDTESYAEPWAIGEPMRAQVVGEVVESRHDRLAEGDLVTGNLYWAEYATVDGAMVERVDTREASPSMALHVLGISGMTAYIGTVEVGHVKPGDTVVVSGAAGAVGSVAGQIARIAGCRVIGIAGTDEKITWLTDDLGFDDAINYRTTDNLQSAIADSCPEGVDLYFENVGGAVSDAVFEQLNNYSRVAVCGKISLYNAGPDEEQLYGPRHLHQRTRTRVEGFIYSDFDHLETQVIDRLAGWVNDDQIRYRETITDGIESGPEAFLGLFEGENIGKQIVRVNELAQ